MDDVDPIWQIIRALNRAIAEHEAAQRTMVPR